MEMIVFFQSIPSEIWKKIGAALLGIAVLTFYTYCQRSYTKRKLLQDEEYIKKSKEV
ncbi:hypothetical protein [Eubacterium sp.]|uniref:hypothetical protein n=1 Tax=Eubacterium sp. TaxID=142586 RepID=UPI002FCB70F1